MSSGINSGSRIKPNGASNNAFISSLGSTGVVRGGSWGQMGEGKYPELVETKMGHQQRQLTAQFKLETVLETRRGETPIVPTCGERQVTDWLVYTWRPELPEKAPRRGETQQTAATVQNDQAERL